MKTIQTSTHLLLVDETAELNGDLTYYLHLPTNTIHRLHSRMAGSKNLYTGMNGGICHGSFECAKIIAVSPKLGDLPEFETLPPNTEDDIEKLAKDWYEKAKLNSSHMADPSSFKQGYKQAKSETMFSLEDMREAFRASFGTGKYGFEQFIQSLTKPKQYEFVPEMEELGEVFNGQKSTKMYSDKKPKIVNNKIQGKWK